MFVSYLYVCCILLGISLFTLAAARARHEGRIAFSPIAANRCEPRLVASGRLARSSILFGHGDTAMFGEPAENVRGFGNQAAGSVKHPVRAFRQTDHRAVHPIEFERSVILL